MTISLTKFTHSCVRIEVGDTAIVFDPGVFSSADELARAFDGATAVFFTHEHADHVSPDALRTAAAANADLRVWAPATVAANFGELGDRVTVVGAGAQFSIGGFDVATYGGHHAVIHPLLEIGYVDNVGYLVSADGASVYHPGDSFVVPTEPVSTLLLPAHAPWSKTGEVIDFAIATRAATAHPVHDGLLNDIGLGSVETMAGGVIGRFGVAYERLAPGQGTTV